jgi:diacylglycerol kinase (ATP)
MKENLINENANYIESIESTSIENIDSFYFSLTDQIPNRIKEDFKKYQNFLLIFVNPKSGSLQGLTVLEHVNKYKVDTIPNYNVISFPVNVQDSSLIKPPQELNEKDNLNTIDNINTDLNSKPAAKFDPLVPFSTIVFNIINKDEMNSGKKFIKKYLSDFPDFKIKILIAGGDGTVLGIVEELNREKIDLNRCIFGAMPFGTGNDLSNALGFGTECQVGDINNFQRVLYTYIIGVESKIDIWELCINMDQINGAIYDVIKNGEKIKEDEEKNKILKFKKTFVTYFSLGFDARVGFEFEQRRTSNRCCNKVVYALEGAKRIFCCKKNYGLTQLLDSFLEGNSNSEINNTNNGNDKNINIITEKSSDSDIEEVPNDPLLEEKEKINIENDNNSNDKRFVFKTRTDDKKDIVLKGNPVSLVCQNIDFYMGGTRDIWGKTSHLGIHQEEASKEDYQEYKRQVVDNFKKQAFDDKQIEFFTFENGIEFGLERVARGLAKRVYQGPGPVYLEFKKAPDETEKVALTKVYINCDGEFYHLQNPTEICVRLNENICNGQINILRNINGL